MYLTGFADEAASAIDGQIRATKELGWKFIESRAIDGKNIHDITDADFDRVCEKLDEEKAAAIKLSTKHRLSKVVRRRFIPLKGENPAAAPLSSHFPWIKEHARPLTKPLN